MLSIMWFKTVFKREAAENYRTLAVTALFDLRKQLSKSHPFKSSALQSIVRKSAAKNKKTAIYSLTVFFI